VVLKYGKSSDVEKFPKMKASNILDIPVDILYDIVVKNDIAVTADFFVFRSSIPWRKQVEYAVLTASGRTVEFSALANFPTLRKIEIHNCKLHHDLSPLSNLQHLKLLDVNSCSGFVELQHLSGIKNLEHFSCRHYEEITDLSPLLTACCSEWASFMCMVCARVGNTGNNALPQ